MPLDFSQKALASTHVIYRELDDEAVLLHVKNGRYLGLNDTGRFFWGALQASASLEEAYREIEEHYDVAPRRLREDLEQFVEGLLQHDLVRLEGASRENPDPS